MIRSDIVSGLLLAALGLYASVKAHGFGLGSLSQPGAGFFPFWAGALIAGCAAAIVVHAVLRASRAVPAVQAREREQAPPADWRRVWACVAVLAVFIAILPVSGFAISAFAALLVLARMDPATTWRGAFFIAALGAAGFWILFVKLLSVRFPPPLLGF